MKIKLVQKANLVRNIVNNIAINAKAKNNQKSISNVWEESCNFFNWKIFNQ